MADNEQKARQLVAEAEKKEKSAQGFFGSLFGSSSKTEEACELYVRAANSFKMAKKWAEAGQCFCKAAIIQLKLQSKHQAAAEYVNASTCYKKGDPTEAVNCLLKAIEIFTDMGRFSIAAKHHTSIAEIYETELGDIDKAVVHYEQSADYFKGEESNSSANKCYLKVAQFSAQLENYEKAIELYEQIAISCMDNQLLKYSAKDHFFKALLCHLCVDLLNGQQAAQKYCEMFPQFADCREYKLAKKLMEAIEEENADMFTDAVKDYDSISRLDQWTTTIMLRIKKNVSEEDLR